MTTRTLEIDSRSTRSRLWLLTVTAAVLALLAAGPAAAETVYLQLENDGLPALGAGFVYEGWLIDEGVPVTTGTFDVLADGSLSRTEFTADVTTPATVGPFILTIEPVPDPDPAPSPVHLVAGDFVSGVAQATVDHTAAIGTDFSSAAGAFILAAPSAGEGGDHRNGIWWLDPAGAPDPGLDLPELPDGWVYEGWVAGDDGPVSTGRFSSPTGADSDAGGFHSGPESTPPFPGQDFVTPPTDLTAGYAAVISVEPDPDDSPAPFVLKPLVDSMIEDVGMGVPQTMANMTSDLPTLLVSMQEPAAAAHTAHLYLDFHGLEDLGADAAYEGWLIVDGAPVSTGTFTVDGGGVPSQAYFPTPVASLDAVSAFVLTIEPVPDTDPAPSDVHLLAGDLIGRHARLSLDHAAALGTDFAEASGAYILAAPSAGEGGDYRNGIWWLDPDGAPDAGFDLPELPDGWVYEGWVAGADGPVTTGRFSSPSGADSDGAGPAAGSEATPPFPGQDFVDPAKDLTAGYAAVLSVEPEPDNSPAPFTLKPLMDPNIDDVGMGVLQPMHANPAPFPSGLATLMRSQMIPAGGRTPGVGGAEWYTDVDAANGGSMPATILVQLLAADRANPAPETVEMSLAAGSAVRWRNIFGSVFDFEGTGALRILSDSDQVTVYSRTYAEVPDGSYGQGIGPATSTDAARFGSPLRLVNLSEGDDFRTNIGFLNPTGVTTEIEVALYDDSGALVELMSLTLEPFEQRQVNQAFPVATEVGTATVTVLTPGGAVIPYGSLVNNGTDDAAFVFAQ